MTDERTELEELEELEEPLEREHTCEECGGVYLDPQPDGSAYFHVHLPEPTGAPEPGGALNAIRSALGRAIVAPPPTPPPGQAHRIYWEGYP